MTSRRVRWSARLCAGLVGLAGLAQPALAHGGGAEASGQSLTVPVWLVLTTGGAAVGASFLLATFVTDRALIAAVDGWRRSLPTPGRVLSTLASIVGVVGLVAVVSVAVVGPREGNVAVSLVWVGWWAGYTMSTYLVGNTWPALNPWRTIADLVPVTPRGYPRRLGAWPAVAALLALVWVEVVSPITDDPRPLAVVVLAYTLVTVAGAVVYGNGWFRWADPVARVFRYYGAVAPLQRTEEGLAARLPGSGLPDLRIEDRSEVAFVLALLWATTFDGFVSTPTWEGVAAATESAGVPRALATLAVLVGGFLAFLAIYRLASRLCRATSESYLSTASVARRFAPSLVAIAAGYHLAHYLGFFVSLAPPLFGLTSSPVALPSWVGVVGIAAVLVGHILAIWVAHATAYDIFPGRLQAIRSQYPFIVVMVFYTMSSLWLVAQPEVVGA